MPEVALIQTIEANGLRVVDVLQRGRNARTGARESQVSIILAERPGPTVPRRKRSKAPIVDDRRVRSTIQREFAKVALFPSRIHPWRVGKAYALALGYAEELLDHLPKAAIESYCGVAHPFEVAALKPGETVVDVGAGSGVDSLLAARMVGADGRVIGVELTEEMLRRAAASARQGMVSNLRFQKGVAEDLPLANEMADVVLANGVVNLLVVDKARALAEAWRVLKPGGRIVLADVVADAIAPVEIRAVPEHWATGLAGPVTEAELLDLLREAGFSSVVVAGRSQPFSGTKLEESARAVGAEGVVIVAYKPTRGEAIT